MVPLGVDRAGADQIAAGAMGRCAGRVGHDGHAGSVVVAGIAHTRIGAEVAVGAVLAGDAAAPVAAAIAVEVAVGQGGVGCIGVLMYPTGVPGDEATVQGGSRAVTAVDQGGLVGTVEGDCTAGQRGGGAVGQQDAAVAAIGEVVAEEDAIGEAGHVVGIDQEDAALDLGLVDIELYARERRTVVLRGPDGRSAWGFVALEDSADEDRIRLDGCQTAARCAGGVEVHIAILKGRRGAGVAVDAAAAVAGIVGDGTRIDELGFAGAGQVEAATMGTGDIRIEIAVVEGLVRTGQVGASTVILGRAAHAAQVGRVDRDIGRGIESGAVPGTGILDPDVVDIDGGGPVGEDGAAAIGGDAVVDPAMVQFQGPAGDGYGAAVLGPAVLQLEVLEGDRPRRDGEGAARFDLAAVEIQLGVVGDREARRAPDEQVLANVHQIVVAAAGVGARGQIDGVAAGCCGHGRLDGGVVAATVGRNLENGSLDRGEDHRGEQEGQGRESHNGSGAQHGVVSGVWW